MFVYTTKKPLGNIGVNISPWRGQYEQQLRYNGSSIYLSLQIESVREGKMKQPQLTEDIQ